MSKSMMRVRLTGDISKQLDDFGAEVKEKALRYGGGAATDVLYNEMRQRVPVQKGILMGSIYRFRDKLRSVNGHQVYIVGPNKRKAPHWHLIEFGHWMYYQIRIINGRWVTMKNQRLAEPRWVPAVPFIRPTFDAKIKIAIDAGKRRIGEAIKEITNGS